MNKKLLIEYFIIAIGAFILAVATSVFFSANHLVTGGFAGLSIIIEELSAKFLSKPIPVWLSNLFLNIPLFLIAFKIFGTKSFFKTFFASASFSLSLYITSSIPPLTNVDLMLVAIFGGILDGIGIGMVMRCKGTTGGTDLFANILKSKFRHIPVSKLIFIADACIITLGFFVFGAVNSLYAIIAAFIISKTIDIVLEGFNFSKAVFIISENSEQISLKIMENLERGITGLSGTGMFTKKSKNVLLCVISSKEIVTIKELVYASDKEAFVIVTDVVEVLGDGFKNIS